MCLWGGGEIKRREGRRRKTDGQIDKQTHREAEIKKRRGLKRRVTEKQRKNH